MVKALIQGQNTPLAGTEFKVTVKWATGSGATSIDVSAFLLNSTGKVSRDEDMIFYGQPSADNGSVAIKSDSGGELVFAVDVSLMGNGVEKVAFTATTPAATSQPLSTINSLDISIHPASGDEPCQFSIDTNQSTEAAMILGELYLRNDAWKFRAVGQGFEGGLAPLAEHMGVTIDDPGTSSTEPTPAPPPKTTTGPTNEPSSAAAPPSVPPVNLSKISLSKDKPSVSLEKRGASLGEIRVNLNWNQKIATKGIFGQAKSTSIDLDLSCLFSLNDGSKGAVQALGQNFGSYNNAPWIHLLGDDRTGSVSDGEWLKINGAQWNNIKTVVIFALIYEGVPNWSSTDGIVSLHVPDHPVIESRMEGESNHRVCAVATLQNDNGSLKMTQENRYFKSAKELDEHYGIGLSWTAGRK